MTAPASQSLQSLIVTDGRHRLVSWLQTRPSWNTLLILAVAAVAAIIRFWNFGSIGYEHWDEYGFVSGADAVRQSWPNGFASISWVVMPLAPYTSGTLLHFLGVNTWIPIAVSATYGTLSAVALYFLGSRLFGNAVGLIAAAVLATAEFSVMYSRMAIAEATFDFWLITSVLFIWLGFERKRTVYYVLAGISSGLLMNTKFDGIFPLVLAGSWLAGELLLDLIRRSPNLLSEYRLRAVGTALMVVLAIALFLPVLVKVAHDPGLRTFVGHFTSPPPHTVIKTPPKFIAWYFWLFTSPPTLLVAMAGIAIGLVRFTRADRLMLIYTAGWFIALLVYPPFPREALSLLPAVGIWAGRAIVEAWGLLTVKKPQWPFLATTAAAMCMFAILVGQIVPLPHMLSLRTKGYADAGAIAAQYQSTGSTIFVRVQSVAFLYLNDAHGLVPRPPIVNLLKEKGSTAVFMTDQTLGWYPKIQALFDLNRDRLEVIDKVPNPLYDEVLLQPATEERLSHLDDPPAAYRYITFWRLTGPLLFPPNWPQ